MPKFAERRRYQCLNYQHSQSVLTAKHLSPAKQQRLCLLKRQNATKIDASLDSRATLAWCIFFNHRMGKAKAWAPSLKGRHGQMAAHRSQS